MTVKELIDRLKEFPPEATVLMCMDWTDHPFQKKVPQEQWEDELGDIAWGRNANWVYLLNRYFK